MHCSVGKLRLKRRKGNGENPKTQISFPGLTYFTAEGCFNRSSGAVRSALSGGAGGLFAGDVAGDGLLTGTVLHTCCLAGISERIDKKRAVFDN
jgi:hypothetical protein